jgi:uncharacterized protein (TIGR02246 family)
MTERTKNIDVALIYELWNEYAAAINAGDLEGWISLWSEEGLQMPPDAPRRVGKEKIQKEMALRFDQFNTSKMTIQPEEIHILGDRAYSYGTYEFEIVPKSGGKTKTYAGKFLDVLEKQLDGSWKIAIDCHSYNKPVEIV